MSMSLRLSDEAVRAPKYSISEDALAALQAGDTAALIASHRDRWCGLELKLEDGDDDESEEDEDDESEEDEEDSDDDADEDDEDSPEGKSKAKSKKGDDDRDPQRKIAALEDEKERLYRGRERARRERDELQKQLDKLKAEGQGDDQLKKQVSELEANNSKISGRLQESLLKIAFLSDNSYEWQNPGLALRAADLSEVEIDDDGKVHGLKSALEALAEEHPYLLKTEQPKKRSTPTSTPTKQTPKSTKTTQKQKAKREEIRRKYKINS